MRKLIVNEWISLDGVIQAPGAADEDTSANLSPEGMANRTAESARRVVR